MGPKIGPKKKSQEEEMNVAKMKMLRWPCRVKKMENKK